MLATTVYLTEAQCDALRAITRETGVPAAVVVRVALDAEIERRTEKKRMQRDG